MLADVNNASIDAIPKSGGTKQAILLSIAAENSGRSSLSRSEARAATAISTFSILALSANLRRCESVRMSATASTFGRCLFASGIARPVMRDQRRHRRFPMSGRHSSPQRQLAE